MAACIFCPTGRIDARLCSGGDHGGCHADVDVRTTLSPPASRIETALKNGQRIIVEGTLDAEGGPQTRAWPQGAQVIPVPFVKVWLATGHTGYAQGLRLLVQEVLKRDSPRGHIFCFRGRRGDLVKIIWHDGQAANLHVRRLERGRVAGGWLDHDHAGADGLSLSSIDWLNPVETWRPTSMG